jgi:hypothetical protein
MYVPLIKQRLADYRVTDEIQEENALKEIVQEVVLAGLSEIGLFGKAAFHGGTALRVFYGLNRFSEDLDFSLRGQPEADGERREFDWPGMLRDLLPVIESYGLSVEIMDKSSFDSNVKKAMLKHTSIASLLTMQRAHHQRKIQIKIEIDVNPPSGGVCEQKLLVFPYSSYITCHDLSSCLAGKLHALLCRQHIKGRDWFDLAWYAGRKVSPNYALLAAAVDQMGPWQGTKDRIDAAWLRCVLKEKIDAMNWRMVRQDVERFVSGRERDSLDLWGRDYFLQIADRIG